MKHRRTSIAKRNPHTGRVHQSGSEADFATLVKVARDAGLIEDVRGLDRGDAQERFRCDVYSTLAVDALLEAAETMRESPQFLRLAREVRRSKIHVTDYLSDFSYTSRDLAWGPIGDRRIIDVKGWVDIRNNYAYRIFSLKKALVLACHSIEIEERDSRGSILK